MKKPDPLSPSVTLVPGEKAAGSGPKVRGHLFGDPTGDLCRAFRQRFGNLASACVDPLYALPLELIQVLENSLKGFLSPPELEFERALMGFCVAHHAMGIAEDTFVTDSVLADSSMLLLSPEDLKTFPGDPHLNAQAIARASEKLEAQKSKGEAYLGWLLTNRAFIRERDALRSGRKSLNLRVSFSTAFFKPQDEDLRQFMSKWQISSMASWEIPIPQGSNRSGVPWPHNVNGRPGMVNVSIPLTQSLPSDDPIREEIESIRRQTRPAHLEAWLNVLERKGKNKGAGHYARMFRIHLYLNLALRSRYAERMGGKAAKLDNALAEFLCISVERVQQLRLDLDRRLR